MKKSIILISLVFMACSLGFSVENNNNIEWLTNYDSALEKAKLEDKNIFVLITAPSWCYWCVEFETNVLNNLDVQDSLEDYVTLMLVDEINGERNKELENFDFSGYPTVRVYDSEGNYVEDLYSQNPEQVIDSLVTYREMDGVFRPLLKDLVLPVKYTYKEYEGGEIINNQNKTWTMTSPDREIVLEQVKYDWEYIYLLSKGSGGDSYFAIPISGGESFYTENSSGEIAWNSFLMLDIIPEIN